MIKKSIILVIAGILLPCVLLFSSGGQEIQEDTGRVTVSIGHRLVSNNNEPFVSDDTIIQYIEDELDLNLDVVFFPRDHYVIVEKFNMMLASGEELPDIIEINPDIPAAYDLLETLVKHDKMTNLVEVIHDNPGRYPNIENNISHPHAEAFEIEEGQLHIMPRPIGVWGHAIYYRKDWADQLGLTAPRTTSELGPFVKALVDADLEKTSPVGIACEDPSLFWAEHLFAGWTGGYEWVERDGKWVDHWITPEMKEAVKWYSELFAQGCIDPDYAVQSREDSMSKFASSRAALIHMDMKYIGVFGPQLLAQNPNAEIDYLPVDIQGPAGTARKTGMYYFEGIGVRNEAEAPERAWDLVDFLLSDKGKELWTYGIEGKHFTRDSQGNIVERNTELYAHEKWGIEGFQGMHGIKFLVDQIDIHGADGYSPELSARYWEDLFSVPDIPTKPLWAWKPIPVKKDLGSRLEDMRSQYMHAFIQGELNIDEEWDNWVQAYRKAGYDMVEEWVNENHPL